MSVKAWKEAQAQRVGLPGACRLYRTECGGPNERDDHAALRSIELLLSSTAGLMLGRRGSKETGAQLVDDCSAVGTVPDQRGNNSGDNCND